MPNRPNSINEEAGLGENWVPVDAPPIIPGRSNPAPPPPPGTLFPQTPQYLQGSIPPGYQHDTSFVDTATLTPNAPKYSLMPLGIQGNPTTNAAIQSTASKSIPATAPGKIELQVPSIFTPIDQTVALPGPLVLALASEIENTVFAGPPVSSTLGGGYIESVATLSLTAGAAANLSLTSVGTDTTAVFASVVHAASATGCVLSGGFSSFYVLPSSPYDGASKQSSISGTVYSSTDTYTTTGSPFVSAGLFIFNGLVSQRSVGGTPQATTGNSGTGSGSYVSTILWGVAPLAVGGGQLIFLYGGSGNGTNVLSGTITLTDSSGNVWYQIFDSGDVGFNLSNCRVMCFYSPNTLAAANPTLTITSTHDAIGFDYYWLEVTPATLIVSSGVPTFRHLVSADLPIIDVSHGGTGAATLPAHNVLLGEGTLAIGGAAPNTSGYYLKDNGVGADPSFAALPTSYYQTVEQATVAKTQRPILNFIAPITATDDAGNTSTDIAVPVFAASGASHATGLVPDPGASAGTTKFLREDATWQTVSASGFNQSLFVDAIPMSDDYWLAVDSNAPDWILPLTST